MYERFTDRARKVMQLANQEAQRFNHEYIGTEHILLGIVKEGSGVAAMILKNNDVLLRKVRLEVEKLVQSGPELITMGILPQTPKTKKVFEYAMEEARDLNNAHVGTEHLLLGLIRVKETVANTVLTKLGLKLELLREEIRGLAELNPESDGSHEQTTSAKKAKTPALDSFTEDVTALACKDKLPSVIGRRNEIDRLTNVLSRRDQNSAILVGESGSGRRSIVHGLAQQIVAKTIRYPIAESRVVMLDQGLLISGTKYRGQLEERVKAIVNEMRRSKNIILFVPQIQTLTRLGLDDDTGLSTIEMLKFAMFQNQIKCIGTCTQAEYDEHFGGDSDFQRLFQSIPVAPPSIDETLEILVGIKSRYESHHRVEIRIEALQAAVELSNIYLPNAAMPEKAIKLIDDASAQLGAESLPPNTSDFDNQIAARRKQKEEAILLREYDKAAKLRDEINELTDKISAAHNQWTSENTTHGSVDVQNIITALSVETGVSEQDIAEGKNIPDVGA